MAWLSQNVLKLFALLVIVGFVVELFIVYTYSPVQPPDVPGGGRGFALVEEEFMGTGVPFVIRAFSDSALFVCNATELPVFQNVLGKPIQISSTPRGPFYLAKVVNDSLSNSSFTGEMEAQVAGACGGEGLYREALVFFNGTSVELQSVANFSKQANVPIDEFDSYTDAYGNSPVALVLDSHLEAGDVVEVNLRATLKGTELVRGSLLLEQAASSFGETRELTMQAKVLSFTGNSLVVLDVPWENRTVKPALGVQVVFDQFQRVDQVRVLNASTLNLTAFNFSFVKNVGYLGNDVVLDAGDATKVEVTSAIASLGNYSLEFAFSKYVAQLNTTVPTLSFNGSVSREVTVAPLENQSFILPENFSALAFQNVSINSTIALLARVSLLRGKVIQIQAQQEGLANGEV